LTWKRGAFVPVLVSLMVGCVTEDPRKHAIVDETDTSRQPGIDGGFHVAEIAAGESNATPNGDTASSHAALGSIDAGAAPAAASTQPSLDTSLNAAPSLGDAGASVVDPGTIVESLHFDAGLMTEAAKNVIFLVADGYGATSIDATRMFINGDTAPLNFETLPHNAGVSTHNARNEITDSAAAATALATGHKADNSVISVAIPGNGADLETALEVQKARGKRTGIVTTHTSIADATPAGFAGHAASRGNVVEIAATYFAETRPNVMLGLFDSGISRSAGEAAGYTVVETAAELAALNLDAEHHVSGQFTEDTVPPLKDLAVAALDILEDSPAGFFVVIEQEDTDTANHNNDLHRMLGAAVEFHETVAAVMAWAEGRNDTLIVVGTDHETGGLALSESNPAAGVVPDHSYSTMGHTNADVRFFAGGVGADRLSGTLDNTDLFPILAGYRAVQCTKGSPCYSSTVDVALHEGDPNTASAAGGTLEADSEPGLGDQSLLGFGNLASYLPLGCNFQAAKLVLHGSQGSDHGIRLHRMLQAWSQASTWNSFGGNGVQADGVEAATEVSAQSDAFVIGTNTFDVTATVAAWLANPSSNHGWVVLAQGGDGVDFGATEATLAPELRLYCE